MILEIYGREDCSLCRRAREIADRLSRDFPVEVRYVDVAEHPELSALWFEVPVVRLGGETVAAQRVSEYRLRRRLGEIFPDRPAEGG